MKIRKTTVMLLIILIAILIVVVVILKNQSRHTRGVYVKNHLQFMGVKQMFYYKKFNKYATLQEFQNSPSDSSINDDYKGVYDTITNPQLYIQIFAYRFKMFTSSDGQYCCFFAWPNEYGSNETYFTFFVLLTPDRSMKYYRINTPHYTGENGPNLSDAFEKEPFISNILHNWQGF